MVCFSWLEHGSFSSVINASEACKTCTDILDLYRTSGAHCHLKNAHKHQAKN